MQFDAFIGYRREGGSEIARLVKFLLESKGKKVFLDVDDLSAGIFDEKLLNTISESGNFILILTQNALDRCHNKDDWLRQEVSHAILKNRNIILIITEGFRFPKPEELPQEIQDLPRYTGLPFNHMFVRAFIEKLIQVMASGEEDVVDTKTKVRRSKVEQRLADATHAGSRVIIFISYSHADRKYFKEMKLHLSTLSHDRFEIWDDTRLVPGCDWKGVIEGQLGNARVGVMLLSPNSVASEFVMNTELPALLTRAEADGALILQAIVRPCRIPAGLRHFQAINRPERTLSEQSRPERDRVWIELVERIEKVYLRAVTEDEPKESLPP